MSDEGYDDVDRFLLHSPLPEPHMAVAMDQPPVPVATHVVGPQHVPADDHALQQAPMMLDPAPATGFHHAPGAIDAVERYHAVTTMEIQPPQMLRAPDPDQAYGFPEAPAPPLAAAATGLDDALSSFEGMFLGDPVGQALYQQFMSGEDDLAAFDVGRDATGDAAAATGVDDSFHDMFSHGDPGSQPLNDQFMNVDREDGLAAIFRSTDVGNASGGAAVEPDDVRPVEEHPGFVPFVPGQLDCTNCHTVWESLHESANHRHYLVVHGTGLGTFHHLITDRMYIGDDGQSTTSEQMYYLDLEQRTHDWVRRFIANLVEALSDHSSGPLKHSWSTSCAAASASSSTTPPVDDAHRPLELDMLKQILYAPATNGEAVAVVQTDRGQAPHQPIIQQAGENSQDDDMFHGTSWHGLNPPTMDSSNLSVQDGESSAAEYYSHLAEQRKRLSIMSMADVIKLLHLSKEDAAKQLKISASSLQRLCRRNEAGRWPSRSINALSSKIKKLEKAALRNVGTTGLFSIKEQIDKLKHDMEQVYESFMKGVRENEMKKGAGSSGSK